MSVPRLAKDGFAAQEFDIPPPPHPAVFALPPRLVETNEPPSEARAPVFPEASTLTYEAIFVLVARLVPEYAFAIPEAKRI